MFYAMTLASIYNARNVCQDFSSARPKLLACTSLDSPCATFQAGFRPNSLVRARDGLGERRRVLQEAARLPSREWERSGVRSILSWPRGENIPWDSFQGMPLSQLLSSPLCLRLWGYGRASGPRKWTSVVRSQLCPFFSLCHEWFPPAEDNGRWNERRLRL